MSQMLKSRLITFSPTGTSMNIGLAIVKGMDAGAEIIDMTREPAPSTVVPKGSVAVVAVPVYGGHVSPVALQRMEHLRADGADAVAVTVYGNRDYGRALHELGDFLSRRGFRIIAGGTFVGEHSYSSAAYPIAQGRPDVHDLDEAEAFGREIARAVATVPEEANLDRISRSRNSLLSVVRFVWGVMKIRRAGMSGNRAPVTDGSKCNGCGICVSVCPVAAVTSADVRNTDAGKCIRCCACVKRCPQGARSFQTPFAPLLWRNFKKRKKNHMLIGTVRYSSPDVYMSDFKYTPENITSLGKDDIFVFGSNLAGHHAGGAARVAVERFGAVMGQGVGMQGQSYAIPTMQGGVETIKPYVDQFLDLAYEWDQNTFYVTRIGCGIAGFTDEQIAPLFSRALDMYNVRLPESFVRVILAKREKDAAEAGA